MAGLELPDKLRRGIGRGRVVEAEAIADALRHYDADGDGMVVAPELHRFLLENRVGGPFFCEVVVRTLWKIAEQRFLNSVETISVEALGRILNASMAASKRPERRYVVTPETVRGLAPRRDLDAQVVEPPPEPARSSASPRRAPRARSAPRSAPRGRSAGSPRARPRPRGAAPKPRR